MSTCIKYKPKRLIPYPEPCCSCYLSHLILDVSRSCTLPFGTRARALAPLANRSFSHFTHRPPPTLAPLSFALLFIPFPIIPFRLPPVLLRRPPPFISPFPLPFVSLFLRYILSSFLHIFVSWSSYLFHTTFFLALLIQSLAGVHINPLLHLSSGSSIRLNDVPTVFSHFQLSFLRPRPPWRNGFRHS